MVKLGVGCISNDHILSNYMELPMAIDFNKIKAHNSREIGIKKFEYRGMYYLFVIGGTAVKLVEYFAVLLHEEFRVYVQRNHRIKLIFEFVIYKKREIHNNRQPFF